MGRNTAKSQTAVPLAVRRAPGVGPADMIGYELDGDRLTCGAHPLHSRDPFRYLADQ